MFFLNEFKCILKGYKFVIEGIKMKLKRSKRDKNKVQTVTKIFTLKI